MCFLDTELIEVLRPAAATASRDGVFASRPLPLFSDGTHVQHWPNHDNHVHIRVSELPYGTGAGGSSRLLQLEPFEAP